MVALGLSLAALSGCANHVGKWVLDSIDPPDARGHYQLASVTLNEDGTYTAERELDGKTETHTGTYTFEGGKLTFRNADGREISYDARLTHLNRKLEVKTQMKDRLVTAVMKRD